MLKVNQQLIVGGTMVGKVSLDHVQMCDVDDEEQAMMIGETLAMMILLEYKMQSGGISSSDFDPEEF